MHIRKDLEQREKQNVCDYGMRAINSKGRVFKEDEPKYRTVFQRDKDRIVHSVAFRRLEYKTQVFANDSGDHYRTRLTHSLEVAGLARATARTLGLNEDLVEAVALAHDLGHPPFGHSGERVLNALMKGYGGFEHNTNAIRVVTFIEQRNPQYRGLNLTYETRESMIKHSPYAKVSQEYFPDQSPLLESYVVDVCDEIAYDNHDLDDGLRSGLIDESDLEEITLWANASKKVRDEFGKMDKKVFRRRVVSDLIGFMMQDLIEETTRLLKEYSIKSIADVRSCDKVLVGFSAEVSTQKKELEKFLYQKLYRNHKVNRMMYRAGLCIEKLFGYFVNHIDGMPEEYIAIGKKEGEHRAVCDYIAGMTDRYAWQCFEEVFSSHGNLLKD